MIALRRIALRIPLCTQRQRRKKLKASPLVTFLELGDATSQNLEFSQRDNVSVSYGEETITETNPLEIRRRHPDRIHLYTFSKAAEAKTGAGWERHIVGGRRTAKMRVQAKRVQRNKVLRVKHKIATSGIQQRDLLIKDAGAVRMKPVYCIYCTETQRNIWTQPKAPPGYLNHHTGCLLADALDVPLATRNLDEIEEKCIPWHYLVERAVFVHEKRERIKTDYVEYIGYASVDLDMMPIGLDDGEAGPKWYTGWNAPTIEDLNEDTGREFDWTGVEKTTSEDLNRLQTETSEGRRIAEYDRRRLHELGISRMLVLDVRDDPDSEQKDDWPRL